MAYRLVEQIEILRGILIARATGQDANNDKYEKIKGELLRSEIGEHLPLFIKHSNNLDEFWQFIKPMYPTYHERRQYLLRRFNPIIQALENGNIPAPIPDILVERKSQVDILLLASNPLDQENIRLDEEMREIGQAIRQAEFRDEFNIQVQMAVQVGDLQEHLLRFKPHIVHFSGHGTEHSEIILENRLGLSHHISPDSLSLLFRTLRDNIRCVVLNTCYSEDQAQAIADHIDCVIGMTSAIDDESAIHFSKAFYRALAYGRDIQTAFDLACQEIDMVGLPDADQPKIIAHRVNPREIFFL